MMATGFIETVKEDIEKNMPGVPKVELEIKGGIKWLVVHERFIVTVLIIAATLFLGRLWLNSHYETTKLEATAAANVLKTQEETNKTLLASYADLQKQTATIQAQLQNQNSQLVAQTAAAYKQAAAQAVQDQQLNNDQLAARLDQLTGQSGIQSSGTGVDLTHQQAATTTATLDQIPALKQQISDDQTIKSNQEKQIGSLITEVNSCNAVNSGLTTQVKDQDTACKAEVKELKAKNLKQKVKIALWSYFAGLITGWVKPL
jgi:hypothetical protein